VRAGAGEGDVRGDRLVVLVLVQEGLRSVKGEKLGGSEIKREQIKGNYVVERASEIDWYFRGLPSIVV
jgi:hypothetical protein